MTGSSSTRRIWSRTRPAPPCVYSRRAGGTSPSACPHFVGTPSSPDVPTSRSIAAALRPRFEVATVPADMRRDRGTQLQSFMDEQYDALDAMLDNRAVLFTGPAGSGKTCSQWRPRGVRPLLAAPDGCCASTACWASAQRADRRISTDCGSQPPPGTACASPAVLRRRTRPADFWEHELVERALEQLLADDETDDFLIVDELQDSPEMSTSTYSTCSCGAAWPDGRASVVR